MPVIEPPPPSATDTTNSHQTAPLSINLSIVVNSVSLNMCYTDSLIPHISEIYDYYFSLVEKQTHCLEKSGILFPYGVSDDYITMVNTKLNSIGRTSGGGVRADFDIAELVANQLRQEHIRLAAKNIQISYKQLNIGLAGDQRKTVDVCFGDFSLKEWTLDSTADKGSINIPYTPVISSMKHSVFIEDKLLITKMLASLRADGISRHFRFMYQAAAANSCGSDSSKPPLTISLLSDSHGNRDMSVKLGYIHVFADLDLLRKVSTTLSSANLFSVELKKLTEKIGKIRTKQEQPQQVL